MEQRHERTTSRETVCICASHSVSDSGQSPAQRNADRPLAHHQLCRRFPDRYALGEDRLQNMALPVRKTLNVPLQMSGLNRSRGLAQRWVGEVVDIAPVSVAILVQGGEQLVAGDREQPSTNDEFLPHMCRFRCTASRISCTIASRRTAGSPARTNSRSAVARRVGVISSSRRLYAAPSPASAECINADHSTSRSRTFRRGPWSAAHFVPSLESLML